MTFDSHSNGDSQPAMYSISLERFYTYDVTERLVQNNMDIYVTNLIRYEELPDNNNIFAPQGKITET